MNEQRARLIAQLHKLNDFNKKVALLVDEFEAKGEPLPPELDDFITEFVQRERDIISRMQEWIVPKKQA